MTQLKSTDFIMPWYAFLNPSDYTLVPKMPRYDPGRMYSIFEHLYGRALARKSLYGFLSPVVCVIPGRKKSIFTMNLYDELPKGLCLGRTERTD